MILSIVRYKDPIIKWKIKKIFKRNRSDSEITDKLTSYS